MVRFKNRYMTVEVLFDGGGTGEPGTFTEAVLQRAIQEALAASFGDAVGGSMQVKYANPATGVCVVRCSREERSRLWGALTLLTQLRGRRVVPRVLHQAGAARTCRGAALAADAASLERRREQLGGERLAQLRAHSEARLGSMEP